MPDQSTDAGYQISLTGAEVEARLALANSALQPSDVGTAAAQNVGTGASNVVQLDGSARLPAVDGSQLTNLPGGGTDDQTAAEVAVSATPSNYSASTADVEAHLAGIDTAIGGLGGGHDALTLDASAEVLFGLSGQALSLDSQTAWQVLAAPAGSNGVPTFRALVAGDLPDMSGTYAVVSTYDPQGVGGDAFARANHTGTQAWSTITGTPTTLSGYGITDADTLPDGQTANSAAGTLTLACVEGAIASYQATLTEAVELALSNQPTAPAMARVVLYATASGADRDISLPTGWLARGAQTWPLTLTSGSKVEIQISTDLDGEVWASYARGIAQ